MNNTKKEVKKTETRFNCLLTENRKSTDSILTIPKENRQIKQRDIAPDSRIIPCDLRNVVELILNRVFMDKALGGRLHDGAVVSIQRINQIAEFINFLL